MDITTLNGLNNGINALTEKATGKETKAVTDRNETFDVLLKSAMNMINQTNEYTNLAEEAEISYAMGLTNNTHDLQAAQQKANISLQYTVAVRNAVLDAYREIMQLQF